MILHKTMQLVLQFFLLFFIFQTNSFMVSHAIECKTSSQDSSQSQVTRTITVSPSGGGDFTTITEALNSIPSGNDKWIKISLNSGTYKEQIAIHEDKQCIVLEGRDRSTTIITFDAHSTPPDSTTFAVFADNFVAKGVTFRNSYNLPPGKSHQQILPAVAFWSNGDKQAFFSCGSEGYQDTLLDYKGRHYFHSCYIEGFADFIWGDGQSVYEQCVINMTGDGFIAAQGRLSANDTSGYVFRQCNVTGTGHGCLGRAYKAFSRVLYIDSHFEKVIDPLGWSIWNQGGHERDILFAEINCAGLGANTSQRVPWMKKSLPEPVLEEYTTHEFIDKEGWIAKLPVPIPQ